MKTKNLCLLAGVLMLAAGMATTGLCEMNKGDFLISPMVGGHVFEGDMHLDHGPMGALGLGYMVTDRCGLEGVLGYTLSETDPGDVDADIATLHLDGFYNLLTEGT